MRNKKPFRRVLLTLLALALTVPAIFAQDLPNRKRNEKPEIKKAYGDWLEKDMPYIITPAEREAFLKLTTDEERERLIQIIWDQRDPDPDTEENEFRVQHYERIAYANEHYSSGIPGWKTDRGRIYIMYGKPDDIETHPMGGAYERPSYHGGGSTSTYPFEIWFYRNLAGIGSGIEIEFVDPTGSGEYRIARSPDEKDALLNIPGAGRTLAELSSGDNKANRIAGIGNSNSYQREQDSPFRRIELLYKLSQGAEQNFRSEKDRLTLTSGPVEIDNPLNFDVRVDFFRQSDERIITALTIQTENKELHFGDSGGLLRARMNIFGRIIGATGRRAGTFEDSVETTASPAELIEAKDRKSAYQKAVLLSPGNYKVEVYVRDVVTGATGYRAVGFEVPRYDPKLLSASTLVLASKLETISNPSLEQSQFMIGPNKVVPNLAGNFRRGQRVGVYLQVYNVGTDQTTLRPSVDVKYLVLSKEGKELVSLNEDWQGVADYGQRLTLARLIDTSNLGAGEYGIEIRIRDRVSGQSLTRSGKFKVTQ